MDAAECGLQQAYVVMTDSSGKMKWGWQSKLDNAYDVCNAVADVADGVLVVGYRTTANNAKRQAARTIWKLSKKDGTQTWMTNADTFGDADKSMGAWEMISVGPGGVMLSGMSKLNYDELTEPMLFKSYGNLAEGTATVMKIPTTSFLGSTAPTAATLKASWTKTFAAFNTAKSAREAPDGGIAVLMISPERGELCGVVKLDKGGALVWGPHEFGKTKVGEATSLAVDKGNNLVIGGWSSFEQGTYKNVLVANLARVDADGTFAWTKTFSVLGTAPYSDGTPDYLRHEYVTLTEPTIPAMPSGRLPCIAADTFGLGKIPPPHLARHTRFPPV